MRTTLYTIIGGVAVVAAGAVAAAALAGGPSTIQVGPGQSIQGAIDGAKPGDTVAVAAGTYHENLTITTDRITLRGAGPGRTILEPPADPHPTVCTEYDEVNGICVTGYVDPVTREPGAPIHGVTVTGLTVRGFSRYGVLLYDGFDFTVANVEASHNHRYGISGYALTGVRYLDDYAHDNVGGGLQIGDSPHANAVLEGNRSSGNAGQGGMGIFLRDTSHGVVRDNRVDGNCVGVVVLSTEPGSVAGWSLRGNTVEHNTQACPPAEEGGPPLSGLGIGLLGTRRTTVENNTVTGNGPTEETPLAGGILLASASDLGGADPAGTTVRGNTASGNDPADLLYDGSGTRNGFQRNTCGASMPDGLCD